MTHMRGAPHCPQALRLVFYFSGSEPRRTPWTRARSPSRASTVRALWILPPKKIRSGGRACGRCGARRIGIIGDHAAALQAAEGNRTRDARAFCATCARLSSAASASTGRRASRAERWRSRVRRPTRIRHLAMSAESNGRTMGGRSRGSTSDNDSLQAAVSTPTTRRLRCLPHTLPRCGPRSHARCPSMM